MGAIALWLVLLSGAAGEAATCADDWRACAGKPWVDGDDMETPLGRRWWPHPMWGEDDEAGSTNWYTRPEVVKRALAEADRGRVYRLGRRYEAGMPTFGARRFVLRIPGFPTGGPVGANQVVYNDEYVATELGQVGTQFDGLGHVGVACGEPGDVADMRFYNGVRGSELYSSTGLKKLGPEKLHPIVARGVLLDVAGAKKVAMLEPGYVVTMADVEAALTAQGMAGFAFRPGDAVLFHTGWGRLWNQDNDRFNAGEPGIGMEVARWLADEVQAGVVGADNWGTEAVPGEDPACVFCIHSYLITRHGIVNQENLKLDQLVADRVYTFTYVYSPMPVTGATGSPGAPLAID